MSATALKERLEQIGFHSPQESVAKAIDRLSTKERITMMSVIKNKGDIDVLIFHYQLGGDLDLDFLARAADLRLEMNVSLDKGRGRRDIVEAVTRSDAMGFGGKIQEKVRDFLGSLKGQ